MLPNALLANSLDSRFRGNDKDEKFPACHSPAPDHAEDMLDRGIQKNHLGNTRLKVEKSARIRRDRYGLA